KHFTFDYVFGQQSTQSEIYESSVVPLLDKFVDGYNVTILAYGQTSSGKTYTMGTGMGDAHISLPNTLGIIPRAIHTLFQFLSLQPPEWSSYQVTVSYLEVYNEDLIDLLAAYEGVARPPITIREDPRGRIYWSGVREEPVYSADQVFQILEAGSRIRQTNTTDMNEKSSRSHAIFSVSLRQERYSGSPARVVHSKFHFVDLAGSERLKRTHSVGERVREGISINAGLLALGNVISALGDSSKKATHIPYRDSKLTRLLQDSLGGN
ncbi:P-loop containing nucleoside triphosphate hydrolase protein, partial [Dimargaris cristalligena]